MERRWCVNTVVVQQRSVDLGGQVERRHPSTDTSERQPIAAVQRFSLKINTNIKQCKTSNKLNAATPRNKINIWYRWLTSVTVKTIEIERCAI